jgi:sec-independent protein translocase protein TatB
MFDVGFAEVLLLALVGLLVLGPERLPRVARTLGGLARKARTSWLSLKRSIEAEMRAEELKKPLENFRKEFKSTVDEVKSGLGQVKSGLDPVKPGLDPVKSDLDQAAKPNPVPAPETAKPEAAKPETAKPDAAQQPDVKDAG